MRNIIRRWLGLDVIESDLIYLINDLRGKQPTLEAILKETRATNAGCGRLIAKLDSQYGKSEFDPAREAESQALAEDVIKRLKAEDAARKHTTGEI